ncbi:MAG TPA: hypothetical protein VK824_00225 [Planctomycetota bacterium]|nr:hypothetical protein [Planctomycetota bacterium]
MAKKTSRGASKKAAGKPASKKTKSSTKKGGMAASGMGGKSSAIVPTPLPAGKPAKKTARRKK